MLLPPLSLYVHFPWCENKCPYCDFNSYVASKIPESDYTSALIKDLRLEATDLKERELTSIFIGGGTPSLLGVSAVELLLQKVSEHFVFSSDIEVTLEVNPGSAETKKFEGFMNAGVNRLSIGVQSFEDDSLLKLGRTHNSRDGSNAIKMAKESGFSNINIDLMYGLPNQTTTSAISDLARAIVNKPAHLSWYELTIEPNTVFFKNPPKLPNEDEFESIQEAGLAFLSKHGYSRYEISAFSIPKRQCKHNLNYWLFGDYLGIGAGAHSKITTRSGGVIRYSKTRNPEDYLQREASGLKIRTSELTKKEIVLDFMLNALRLTNGFTFEQFENNTYLDPDILEPELRALNDKGLIFHDILGVKTTSLAQRYLNDVIQGFMEIS